MARILRVNVDELQRMSGRLTKAQKEVIKIATDELRDYGRKLRTTIADEVPVRDGVLKSTVRMNVRKQNTKEVELELTIGNKQRPEVVVKTILFGSKPHTIKPKKKGYPLKFMLTPKGGGPGTLVRAMSVKHPGTNANNFLERAIEITKEYRTAAERRVTLRIASIIQRGKDAGGA